MGVVSGRGKQEACVASGWNLWVWLGCLVWLVGVVVRLYPHNNYYFSLLQVYILALFLAAASKEHSRSFKYRDHAIIINYIDN